MTDTSGVPEEGITKAQETLNALQAHHQAAVTFGHKGSVAYFAKAIKDHVKQAAMGNIAGIPAPTGALPPTEVTKAPAQPTGHGSFQGGNHGGEFGGKK